MSTSPVFHLTRLETTSSGHTEDDEFVGVPFEAATPGYVLVDFAADTVAFRDILARDVALQQVLSQVKDWVESGLSGYFRLTDTNGVEVGFALHGASGDDLPKQPGARMRFSIDVNNTLQNNLHSLERGESIDEAWTDTLSDVASFIDNLKDAGDPQEYRNAAEDGIYIANIEFDSWGFAPPTFSPAQIDRIAEAAMHAALDFIQGARGLMPGTVAAEEDKEFFASQAGDIIQEHLRKFILHVQDPSAALGALKEPSLMLDDDLVNMVYALDEGMVFGIASDDKKMDGNMVYAICLDNYRPGHQESGEIFVVNADGIAAADGGGDATVIEIEDDDLYELGPDERQSLRDVANGRKLADSHDVDFAMLAQPNGTELN